MNPRPFLETLATVRVPTVPRKEKVIVGPQSRHTKRRIAFAKEVYSEALRQIASMRAWFATQRELHLLGSSVLIVYEGDRTDRSAAGMDEGSIPVRVKAIDFCNYVEGAGDRLSVMLDTAKSSWWGRGSFS